MTISRNEDDELVVTLTISPNMTEEVGSEFFITYTKEEGKEGVEPNLELNVMGWSIFGGKFTHLNLNSSYQCRCSSQS